MKKLNIKILLILLTLATFGANAQEVTLNDSTFNDLSGRVTKAEGDLTLLKKIKINGWIQAQYQHIDTLGAASVAGGNFQPFSDSRMILRRGRIKFTYEQAYAQYVLQLDVVDPTLTPGTSVGTSSSAIPFAVNVRDFYMKINAPFWNPLTLTVGMQNRPFGFEVSQSSQVRETPERSRFVQSLLPNERDLGAMVTLQAPKTSPLHVFKINAGIFNGPGIAREFDSRKDFIGQVTLNSSTKNERIQYGLGVSYYNGSVLQTDSTVYSGIDMTNSATPNFIANKNGSNIGEYAKRTYYGVDAQVSFDHGLGITTLRAEYVAGTQPGVASSSRSSEFAPVGKAYVRNFNAGYFYFIHKIANLPFQLVYKYDVYDPNSKVAGYQINSAGKFGTGDIKYTTNGFGVNYLASANLKFMFYYDMITNETVGISGYNYDKSDNVFTARMQFRF